MKIITFILLGTNLGDRKKNLTVARNAIELAVGQILKASSIYETAAWGKTDQPKFLNQAIEIETEFRAEQVLQKILAIEQAMGRIREEKWGERIIDIDILLYGDEVIDKQDLHIPHPQLANRRFALEPLSEIGSKITHPILKITIGEMLEKCTDQLGVRKIAD